jgi:hypothetical protein
MTTKKRQEKRIEADVPIEIRDKLDDFLEKHPATKKKELVRAMAQLFIELPEKAQIMVLTSREDLYKRINKAITDDEIETFNHCQKEELIARITALEVQIKEVNIILHKRLLE